ncbi:hypothetical protein [Nocardia sp. NPDC051570]|uniref:hypothetical protein n=1 Tax=Nocardia sp. NPDC051570 TaxID=3364324 RepID=UPI0037BD0894
MRKALVPQGIESRFVGITEHGHLIIRSGTTLVALTPCCQAVATFHDYTLCCKRCWQEVSLEFADEPQVAIPRDQLTITLIAD